MSVPTTDPKPTPAQSRELLKAIYTGKPIRSAVGASSHRMHANLLRSGWIKAGMPTDAAYDALGVTRAPVSEQVHRLNGPMLARLRECAADTSSNWDGKITIYPPEARELVSLVDAALSEAVGD
jgi:hypothetical protein